MDAPKIPLLPIVSGSEIKALRSLLGMTQAEFAERFFLSKRSLQNWEQNTRALDTAGSMFFRLVAFNPDTAASVLQDIAARHFRDIQRQPATPASTKP